MKKNILEKFNNTIFVTKDMFRRVSDESEDAISKSLLRWSNSRDIITLRNGLYITKNTYDKYIKKDGFLELIANRLRTPSYVSLEYALSKYQILTETIYPITSVTLKTKREYNNRTGKYIFRSIKKSLFLGYKIDKFLLNDYYISTKAKALFDYLYFKKDTLPLSTENINLVEELRLNLDTLEKNDIKELLKYSKIANEAKLSKIIDNIVENAPIKS